MERKWTDAQKSAIDIRGKTLLVCAAAGSGKTATLTERIIQRITDTQDPADISKMLIVTFTRAAAAELRTRIFAALSDALANNPSNKHLASQLMKIGSAQISTIDSFYFQLLQSNFSSLGLSSSYRIAEDAEYSILAHRVMESVIDNFYETQSDFPSFVECFVSIRQLSTLPKIFLDIHQKLSSIPEGIEFLKTSAEDTLNGANNDFFNTSYGRILQKNTREIFKHYLEVFKDATLFISLDNNVASKYGISFAYDYDFCLNLLNAVNNSDNGYSHLRSLLCEYAPIALKSLPSKYSSDMLQLYKAKRTEFAKCIKALSQKSFSKTPQTIALAMEDTARHISTLYRLLHSFEEAITEEKRRIGILTFTDIRRYTLELLVNPDGTPTDVARQYAEQFSDIYIDEYQDVDRVQDLIFCSISKPNNRFMVGDIKQSIYEFRGAEPKLFADYRLRFPVHSSKEAQNAQSISIFMSNNFRCDKNIIDFTNLVCSRLFTVASNSIGYSYEDNLKFSKVIKNEDYVSPKVNISIIKSPSKEEKSQNENFEIDESASNKELEAEYIASEIERLIQEEKKADGTPILPSDIAVLFRSKAIAPYISAALKKRGILSNEADAKKYFENPDVLMVLCILNAIDNPERDTYLAGALRSPIFDFSMDEMITLRASYDNSYSLYAALCQYSTEHDNKLSEKCRDFISTLENWRHDAASMPVDKFLQILFDSERFIATGIVSQVKDDGEGGNILLLYEYARTFENGSFKGLYQFLEYITSMIEDGKTFSVSESSASDRVSLMTIHKSKGLEFPVCFLCDTTHSIRSKDVNESLVIEYPYGAGLKISGERGFARINTPIREAIISKSSIKRAEEEMRILYVAFTRARERLYITAATSKDTDKMLSSAKIKDTYFDRYSAIHTCSSYLDWILACCSECSQAFELNIINSENITPARKKLLLDHHSYSADPAVTKRLKEKFSFEYPYAELRKVPSKISVSRLFPDMLDENNDTLELFSEEKRAKIPDFFLEKSVSKASAAERGTATHLFLQFCDFEYAHKNGAQKELRRLEEKRFLPQNAASLIYTEELERFFNSELIEKILSAKKIIREQRFNVELSPKGFTSDLNLLEKMREEVLAVQGVIDLILIKANGEVELYDYKTDRLTALELSSFECARERMNKTHGQQLFYYSKAIEFLMGKKCSRIAVYSTHSAKLYDIDLSPFDTGEINLI